MSATTERGALREILSAVNAASRKFAYTDDWGCECKETSNAKMAEEDVSGGDDTRSDRHHNRLGGSFNEEEIALIKDYVKEEKATPSGYLLLPEDTFSFIAFAPVKHSAFWLAFLVFFIQVVTLAILLADDIDLNEKDNPLNIPADVDRTVRASQFLALLIAVLSHTDTIESLNLFFNGYHEEEFKEALESNDDSGTSSQVSRPPSVEDLESNEDEFFDAMVDQPKPPASGEDHIEKSDPSFGDARRLGDDVKPTPEGHPQNTEGAALEDACDDKEREPCSQTKMNCFTNAVSRLKSCLEPLKSTQRWRWYSSAICRLVEGCFCLVVTFILIMRENTARDVLLNFTAVEFVSSIDNATFFLAKTGYLGKDVRDDADNRIINADKADVKKEGNRTWFFQRRHTILLFIIFLGLLSGYCVITVKQSNGDYLPSRTVYAQFGDEFLTYLGTYSGLYQLNGKKHSGRVVFEAKRSKKSWLGYCKDVDGSGYWTLTTEDQEGKHCDWLARSSKSASFDILETSESQWFVKAGNSTVPIQHFEIFPFPGDGQCGNNGEFEDDHCICNRGWFGLSCSVPEPCKSLAVDIRHSNFQTTREWSSLFVLLRKKGNNEIMKVYEKPVFVNYTGQAGLEIILFAGRRWVLFSLQKNESELEGYLERFHGNSDDFDATFISDSVDVGTPNDVSTPESLGWFHAVERQRLEVDSTRPSDAVLICAVCDATNKCNNNGHCINGTCECPFGARGRLCEEPPLGNGHCDSFLNLLDHGFDAGDCCESTCVSSTAFECGKAIDEDGKAFDKYVDIGYFFCALPKNQWRKNGPPIHGSNRGRSGAIVALSGSASVMAVGAPGLNTVYMYYKDGSRWIEWAELVNQTDSSFPSLIAMSTGLSAVNNPSKIAPVIVAVGGEKRIWVYDCAKQQCRIQDIPAAGTVQSLSISSDGRVITFTEDSLNGIKVYVKKSSMWNAQPTVYTDALEKEHIGKRLVDSSGDAKVLVLGTPITAIMDVFVVFTLTKNGAEYEMDEDWLQLPSTGTEIMVLSEDGAVMSVASAIVAGSNVTVFERIQSLSSWLWMTKASFKVDALLCCMDISFDGSVIALATQDDGSIFTYNWNGTHYQELGNFRMDGGELGSIALSVKGSVLAVGQPSSEIGAGRTEVYEYVSTPCNSESDYFRLSLTMDDNASLLRWNLAYDSGDTIMIGRYSDDFSSATVVEEACLERDRCVSFTISNGDAHDEVVNPGGIALPGGYHIFLNSEEYRQGGRFQWYERVMIGSCDADTCRHGTSIIRIAITTIGNITDNGTSWSLVNEDSGSVLFNGGNLSLDETSTEEICVPTDACVSFSIIQGSSSVRYSLYDIDRNAIAVGGLLGNETSRFMNCSLLALSSADELSDAVDDYLYFKRTFGERVSVSPVALKYGFPIGSWNVSQITDFSFVFSETDFNDPLDGWDVSNALMMNNMFQGNIVFDQNLSKWDVAKVEDMSSMFRGAYSFHGFGLQHWNVSSVSDMSRMFDDAVSFGPERLDWDVSRVIDMSYMFNDCYVFNGNLSLWSVSSLEHMDNMFARAWSFEGIGLSLWDVSKVVQMDYSFWYAYGFNENISGWNVSSVVNMRWAFHSAASFNQSLCPWGQKLSSADLQSIYGMFRRTSCMSEEDPNLSASPPGPFCHECSPPSRPP